MREESTHTYDSRIHCIRSLCAIVMELPTAVVVLHYYSGLAEKEKVVSCATRERNSDSVGMCVYIFIYKRARVRFEVGCIFAREQLRYFYSGLSGNCRGIGLRRLLSVYVGRIIAFM